MASPWFAAVSLLISSILVFLVTAYGDHELNRIVPSRFRASFISTKSFIYSLSAALSMPLVGWLIDATGPLGAMRWLAPMPLVSLGLVILVKSRLSDVSKS